jgi:hemoglobin
LKKASFEALGGRPILEAISKTFYDKVYKHPWLKKYFQHVSQEHIESQQVDFMQQALGGPSIYRGRTPPSAHVHIHVTEDLFELRESLLLASLKEHRASDELILRWNRVEQAFKNKIVKKSIQECKKRYPTDDILDFSA